MNLISKYREEKIVYYSPISSLTHLKRRLIIMDNLFISIYASLLVGIFLDPLDQISRIVWDGIICNYSIGFFITKTTIATIIFYALYLVIR